MAKLPNETYSEVLSSGTKVYGLRIKADNFNFSEEQLAEWLTDLFFTFDYEAF